MIRSGIAVLLVVVGCKAAAANDLGLLNHNRPMVDAHNCYPYDGQWTDRLQRALKAGFPVSIEQDLAWYVDPGTGQGRVVVSHTAHPTGAEPTLRDYFFEQVRPIVERSLAADDRRHWPLIVLHLDFKDDRPEILKAVWRLLGDYRPWLSTAMKTARSGKPSPISRGPVLVLTEGSDAQAEVFDDEVPVGDRLRLFGSAHTQDPPAGATQAERAKWIASARPDQLLTARATNYRRWWNGTWWEVEYGGQTNAGAWTKADDTRLRSLVDNAHERGLWVRFYTLDGFSPETDRGWFAGYNFGSLGQAQVRWQAAARARVDFIATDQYDELAASMR